MSELIKRVRGYAVIPNSILNDEKLSFKAKGLWAFINSKPEGWQFSVERIALQTNDGVSLIKSGLRELEDSSYLERARVYANGKITGYNYILSDEKPAGGKPASSKPDDGKPTDLISNTDVSKQDIVKKIKIEKNIKKNPSEKYEEAKEEFLLNNTLHTVSVDFDYVVTQFIQHRDEIKKPMTKRAIVLFLMKVNDWSFADLQSQISRSIISGWSDVYPATQFKTTYKPKEPTEPTEEQKRKYAPDLVLNLHDLD